MQSTDVITDEDFIPFLRSLGVETYNKSFEWILNDSEFSGVMRWMYENLDHNNALSAREEYRYAELEKKNTVMSNEDLETSIASIDAECKGICHPGDLDCLGDMKMSVDMLNERLQFLEKKEVILKDLVKQNDLAKQELVREVTNLNAAHQQCSEDETAATKECLSLAEELEVITDGILDVITDAFDLYSNCHIDKDIAKRFLVFGSFEAYRQSQALFRSHFDLFTAKKFDNKQNDSVTDDDVQSILIQAKNMEERILDALSEYIDSKAELNGEQAKLALVMNYVNVHPSQVTASLMENQSVVQLLKQEEMILEQEIQNIVQAMVESRTKQVVETTATSALVIRERIHNDLSYLLEVSENALALDRILYLCLRHSLRTVEHFAQFAAHMRQYCIVEGRTVQTRVDAMNDICNEQDNVEQKLIASDTILRLLYKILGAEYDSDVAKLMKLYNDFKMDVQELNGDIEECFRKKEIILTDFKNKQLEEYIHDGCTRRANCRDRRVATLSHSLLMELERVDKKAVDASVFFTHVKNGGKNGLRKLWQWFLTDQAQLLAAIRNVQSM